MKWGDDGPSPNSNSKMIETILLSMGLFRLCLFYGSPDPQTQTLFVSPFEDQRTRLFGIKMAVLMVQFPWKVLGILPCLDVACERRLYGDRRWPGIEKSRFKGNSSRNSKQGISSSNSCFMVRRNHFSTCHYWFGLRRSLEAEEEI